MSNRTLGMSDALLGYLRDHTLRETEIQKTLREKTAELEMARMQIAPEQGQFMALMVELIGAQKIVEVGTFTGYSALSMAMALPEGGQLVACDVSKEWTDIGKEAWEEAGVADKIVLRLGPAVETLQHLLSEGGAGCFDLAFLDADKANYDAYYESCLQLLRPGGLVMVDNVLWGGSVIDVDKQDEDTQAIRALNRKIHADTRVTSTMLPLADGLMLARKH